MTRQPTERGKQSHATNQFQLKSNFFDLFFVEKKKNGNVKYWVPLIALNFMICRNVAVQSELCMESRSRLRNEKGRVMESGEIS